MDEDVGASVWMKGIRTPFTTGMEHENWRNGGIPLFYYQEFCTKCLHEHQYVLKKHHISSKLSGGSRNDAVLPATSGIR